MSAPSADLAREQAYLVSRGVRPMALLGVCDESKREEAEGLLILHGQHYPEAIPFAIAVDGECHFGFAAAAWAADLYAWAQKAPVRQRERIEGLLLGYGAREIAANDERMGVGCAGWPKP